MTVLIIGDGSRPGNFTLTCAEVISLRLCPSKPFVPTLVLKLPWSFRAEVNRVVNLHKSTNTALRQESSLAMGRTTHHFPKAMTSCIDSPLLSFEQAGTVFALPSPAAKEG
jgi:hypothetical protein